jgi:hypothetical protein
MKSFLKRPALLLALAASLSACGGKASFDVAGTLTGLKYAGLELSDGRSTIKPTADGRFVFPNTISYGESYAVSIKTNPAHQTCTVINPSDTAGRLAVIDVVVACSVNTHSVGGTVRGLSAGQVELINGSQSGTVVVLSTSTDFKYAFTGVPYDTVYGISVLTQPDTLKCTVGSNNTGKMADADVTDINVSCVPK